MLDPNNVYEMGIPIRIAVNEYSCFKIIMLGKKAL